MKKSSKVLGLYPVFLICIFSVIVVTNAEVTPFYPSEGTVSTYRWNFYGFPAIYTLNSSHYDYGGYDDSSDIYVENPTYSEFSVSYNLYNGFLEEVLDGTMHNQSHSLNYMPSFLINYTTREYVNEEGEGSGGLANGYIDPRNLTLGTEVIVGFTPLNTTVKETINIAGNTREAWKLEFISENINQTLHYDTKTGILLDAEIKTREGSIGQAAHLASKTQESTIVSHKQVLISTNAWETTQTTELPLMVVFLGLIVIFNSKKKK